MSQLNTPQNAPYQVVVTRMDMSTVEGFEALQRAAKMLCSSSLVPKQFQGAQNLSNCVIALNLASRMNADPLMVLQNLYVVYGRPGWSAKFLIATFNQSGKFTALRFEEKGKEGSDDWGMRAYAVEVATGERITGPWIDVKMAKSNGWWQKDGSKWPSMTDQMLRYRSAAWFINTVAPELAMGIPTAEEIKDNFDFSGASEIIPEPNVDPAAPEVETEILNAPAQKFVVEPKLSRAEMLKQQMQNGGNRG